MPFLPREGLTLEFLVQPWIKLLLQPLVTGALLAAAIRRPESVQPVLSRVLQSNLSIEALKVGLKWLVGLGTLHHASRYLDRKAYNNWTSDNLWDWTNELIVVTGGSSGMGEAMVRQFATRGIKVVIIDIQEPLTKNLPENVHFFHADLSSIDSIRAVSTKIRDQLGDPTVLINCAGIGTTRRSVADETSEFVQKIFAVNTMSHFHLIREFLPAMVKRNHGHVVNVASGAGLAVFAGNVAYGASKAAAIALHEGLAQEIRHRHRALKVRTR
jgi:NADP-dependent 3-hydroxy acid dehydrogenase YdfG